MSDNPNWLSTEPKDNVEALVKEAALAGPDPTTEEIIDYLIRGLIAFKRLIMTPANTSNEKDAANDLAKIALEGIRFGDVGPKR